MSGANKPNNITIKRKSPNGSTYTYTLTNNRSGISKIRVNNNKTHKFSEAVVENITRDEFFPSINRFFPKSNNKLTKEEEAEFNRIEAELSLSDSTRIPISATKNNTFKILIKNKVEYTSMKTSRSQLFNKLYTTLVKETDRERYSKKEFIQEYSKYARDSDNTGGIDMYNIEHKIVLFGQPELTVNGDSNKVSHEDIIQISRLANAYFKEVQNFNKLLKTYNGNKTYTSSPEYNVMIKLGDTLNKEASEINEWWENARAAAERAIPSSNSNITRGGTRRRKRQKKYKLRTAKRKIRRI
jgi:hypothetical protein